MRDFPPTTQNKLEPMKDWSVTIVQRQDVRREKGSRGQGRLIRTKNLGNFGRNASLNAEPEWTKPDKMGYWRINPTLKS